MVTPLLAEQGRSFVVTPILAEQGKGFMMTSILAEQGTNFVVVTPILAEQGKGFVVAPILAELTTKQCPVFHSTQVLLSGPAPRGDQSEQLLWLALERYSPTGKHQHKLPLKEKPDNK